MGLISARAGASLRCLANASGAFGAARTASFKLVAKEYPAAAELAPWQHSPPGVVEHARHGEVEQVGDFPPVEYILAGEACSVVAASGARMAY